MSLSMADVTLSGFKEPNWTYIYLFHIYMRDHVAMSGQGQKMGNILQIYGGGSKTRKISILWISQGLEFVNRPNSQTCFISKLRSS